MFTMPEHRTLHIIGAVHLEYLIAIRFGITDNIEAHIAGFQVTNQAKLERLASFPLNDYKLTKDIIPKHLLLIPLHGGWYHIEGFKALPQLLDQIKSLCQGPAQTEILSATKEWLRQIEKNKHER